MRRLLAPLALAAASALAPTAHALGLAEAFEAARRFDGQYRAASYELESARQGVPIARSSMLPSITLNASTTDVSGKRSFPNSLNQDVRVPVDYNAPQASLQLRTPILNFEGLTRMRMAELQETSAEFGFEAKGLDLADRLGMAYLQVLLSTEAITLGRAEIAQLQAQAERARQRQQRGEGTRTEVAQTQAQLEVARVRLVDQQDQLQVARRVMRRLTGIELNELKALPGDFKPPESEPTSLIDWLEQAEQRNPALRARGRNIEVARLAVERVRANHLPRLDLVATLAQSRNETLSNLNQSSTLKSIGLQLSVPIYSGGGIEATARQAVADLARTEEELRIEREQVQVELQRQYMSVRNGRTRIEGYQRAAEASEVTLEGTTRALAAGLATQADVLEAQTRVFAARRELAQARYEYLAARLRLGIQAGTPVHETIADIDRQLTADFALEGHLKP